MHEILELTRQEVIFKVSIYSNNVGNYTIYVCSLVCNLYEIDLSSQIYFNGSFALVKLSSIVSVNLPFNVRTQLQTRASVKIVKNRIIIS